MEGRLLHIPYDDDATLNEFGLDPAYQSYRKLFVKSIRNNVITHENQRYQLFEFMHHHRGCTKVEVCGIVTCIARKSSKAIINVDDGTGVIKCVKFVNSRRDEVPFETLSLGDLIDIKGTLTTYETNLEDYGYVIHITCLDIIKDPNVELLFWSTSMLLNIKEYSKTSFVVSKHKHSTPSSSSSLCIPKCSCSSNTDRSIDNDIIRRVKDELLYCKCTCSYSKYDVTFSLRATILHHFLTLEDGQVDGTKALEITKSGITNDPILVMKCSKHMQMHYHDVACAPYGIDGLVDTDQEYIPVNHMQQYTVLLSDMLDLLVKDGVLIKPPSAGPSTACNVGCAYQLLSVPRCLLPALENRLHSFVETTAAEAQRYYNPVDYLRSEKILELVLSVYFDPNIRAKFRYIYEHVILERDYISLKCPSLAWD